jgi:glutathionyl-hydroquinone reductase
MTENEIKIIEKKAQIRILNHLFDHLCNSELPELGKKALRLKITRLNEEIDGLSSNKTEASDSDRH